MGVFRQTAVTNKLKKDRILIENFAVKKMEYPPHIKHIWFLLTHKSDPKKPKELNLSHRTEKQKK